MEILLSRLVGYPKCKVRCSVAASFPLAKMLRFEYRPVGLRRIQEGDEVNNGAVHNRGCLLHLDLHTQQVTLLPMSIEGLSIPPALLFTKDQRKR